MCSYAIVFSLKLSQSCVRSLSTNWHRDCESQRGVQSSGGERQWMRPQSNICPHRGGARVVAPADPPRPSAALGPSNTPNNRHTGNLLSVKTHARTLKSKGHQFTHRPRHVHSAPACDGNVASAWFPPREV